MLGQVGLPDFLWEILDKWDQFRFGSPCLAQERLDFPEENPRVPEIMSALEICFRPRLIGLFDKLFHTERRGNWRCFPEAPGRHLGSRNGWKRDWGRMPNVTMVSCLAASAEACRSCSAKVAASLISASAGRNITTAWRIKTAHEGRSQCTGRGGIPLGRLGNELMRLQNAGERRDMRQSARHWSGQRCGCSAAPAPPGVPFPPTNVISDKSGTRCFGLAMRLKGQNRSPLPPAMMQA